MILHDFKCEEGHFFEAMTAWNEDTKPCPRCRRKATMVFLPQGRNAVNFDPVVVFRAPNGKIRFPGRSNSKPPKGYERVELKSAPEIRKFEGEMNRRELSRWRQKAERDDRVWGAIRQEMRGQLRDRMRHFSAKGRAFAEAAMRRNDEAPSAKFDPGFHVEAFSFNSSNREEFRDRDTGLRGRK